MIYSFYILIAAADIFEIAPWIMLWIFIFGIVRIFTAKRSDTEKRNNVSNGDFYEDFEPEDEDFYEDY